jgi:hypothetical protein
MRDCRNQDCHCGQVPDRRTIALDEDGMYTAQETKDCPCCEGLGGEGCSESDCQEDTWEHAETYPGICERHEKEYRRHDWDLVISKARTKDIPLCESEGCPNYALLEGDELEGFCLHHIQLPHFVTSSAASLEAFVGAAVTDMRAENSDPDLSDSQRLALAQATILELAQQVSIFVARTRKEEGRRAKSPAGSILGEQQDAKST